MSGPGRLAADRQTAVEWRRLSRLTGVAGLAGTVLVLGPISAASGQEPGFTGDAAVVQAFFASTVGPGFEVGQALTAIGLVVLLWFSTGLAMLLTRAEGVPPWRSVLLGVTALPFPILTLNGLWSAASYRSGMGITLDGPTALLVFDTGNIAFANGWLSMGGFAAGVGWVVIRTCWAPRWTGWLAVLSGAGLVLCRFGWSVAPWYFPYALWWLLVIGVSIKLLRATSRRNNAPVSDQGDKS
ncbi:MAG: hypothetical protein QM650_09790 [Microlunatus sp.]